ncbi:MAG: MFS transporter [Candidatus Bathyarchaeota archaeon]|nr:MFS transporter [Candidatus Bathyarchaeota archaeon]
MENEAQNLIEVKPQTRLTGFIDSVIPSELNTGAKLFLTGAIVNGISNGAYNSILQLYLIALGFTAGDLGTIFLFNPLTCAILAIPCGILADRYGKGKMIAVGFIAVIFAVCGMFVAKSLWAFGFIFAMFGISNATSTVMMPLYSTFYKKQEMEKGMGLYGLINISAMSLGSLTGYIPAYMISNLAFSELSAYKIVIIVASILFVLQYVFYLAASRGIEEKLSEGFSFKLKSWRPVLKFSALTLSLNIAGAILFSFFPYYVNQKFGIASAGLGTLFFISNLTQAVSRGVAAGIAKKLGNMKSIVVGISLSAIFFFLMPLSPSFGVLSLFYVLRSGTRFMSEPIVTSLFLKSLSEDEMSTANSIRMIAMNGSGAVSAMIGGFLLENVGLDSPAYLGAALTLVLAGLYPVLLSKEIKEASES